MFLKESARFKFYRIGFSWFGSCQEGGNLQGAGVFGLLKGHISPNSNSIYFGLEVLCNTEVHYAEP